MNGRAQKVQAKLRADHVPSASTFFIGAREAPTSEAHYPFLGDVAAVRISKNAIYDRDFTPEKAFKTDSDTIGVYNFKDGPSSVLKDSSGLERHGDITGAWWINIDDKRPPAGAWASYFNGKDLRGWREHSPGKGNWTVRDGLLIGHDYLHSERLDWGRFHLKMEAKLKGTGEIYYHIHHNDWKGGIQLIPHGRTGLLGGQIRSSIDPNWHPSIKEVAIAKDDWFTLEVISDGPRLLTKTNGVTTADFTLTAEQQKKWYQKGMISIGTGSKGEWTIRKIEIMELPTEEPGWVQLFNRKDTTGWKYHDKHPGDWTVKDGILTSGGKGGNYLYTVRDDYADFHLRAEVQLEKGFSSAIFFRTGFGSTWEDNKMQPGLDGPYTLISRPFDENPTGSLRVTGLPFSHAEKGLVDAKDWFVLEIIAKGNLIESLVNGKPAATLIDKRKKGRFEKGHIALQMLNPDVVVRYRKIEIKELPAKAPAAPVWEVVDLHKDSKVEQQGKNVTFTLPGKLRYMIATEVNRSTDAPRLVQAIDGDFDLYAKLLPLPELPGKPSTGAGAGSIAAGLLLWQDDENFLTLFQTKLAKSEKGMVYVSGAVDGKPYQLDPKFRSQVLADPSKPIYLRVLRRGNVVKGYLSTDGVQWNIVREVTTKFPGKIDVGVCASINQATGAQVEFADLSLTPPSAALAPFDAK